MSENNDFFAKNERFRLLIKHYARKSNDPDIEWDLWTFLWELETFKKNLTDRYIAVCIRNCFIKLNKKRCNTEKVLPLIMDMPDNEIDVDLRLDLCDSIEQLPKQQRKAIYGHYYEGKSFEQIAKETTRTRQAIRQNCVSGVLRLRDIFEPKN